MASEYDPVFAGSEGRDDGESDPGLDAVRRRFEAAARPFLSSSTVWIAWALVLPGAALATERAHERFGPSGTLLLWSTAILAGGLVELGAIRRRRAPGSRSPLAAWALRIQGNLSLVGVGLSAALLWAGRPALLPGLWLLLLGHSFFTLGGLAFRPMRTAGILFQVGGFAALWPALPGLAVFAAASAAGCLWMARGVARGQSTR